MGYTHYWYRPLQIPQSAMQAIADDFNKIILALDDTGVKLAGGLGRGLPTITAEEIWFNGSEDCGHPKNAKIVIPWPAKGAGGVNHGEPVAGNWFAGTTLATRTCDGDCSYETVWFPADMAKEKGTYISESDTHKGLYFACCKTAFRPYDVAVTALLLIAKHYLGDGIIVSSDGEDEFWLDAKVLCYAHLGYGPEYQIDGEGEMHLRTVPSTI